MQIYGQQIGTVTDVALQLDPVTATARVRVAAEIQPERLKALGGNPNDTPEAVAAGW